MGANEGISPGDFEDFINKLKPDGIYVEDKHMARLKGLAVCYKAYEDLKIGKSKDVFDERGRYDYEDMILVAQQAIMQDKNLKKHFKNQFKYIMVDEYQDTNGAQLNLLFLLSDKTNPNLSCVGDDDQSIYRFQGASVGNFKVLKKRRRTGRAY